MPLSGHLRGGEDKPRQAAHARLVAALSAIPDLRQVFSSIDPYAADFSEHRDAALAAALKDYWPAVRSVFPDMAPDLVLRHAWAATASQAMTLAALHHSVSLAGDGSLRKTADELGAISREEIFKNSLAWAVFQPQPEVPDLGEAQRLMPGMRVRYALAHELCEVSSMASLVATAQATPAGSRYVRRRELLGALREAARRGIALRPYEMIEFLMRPAGEHALILSGQSLARMVLPAGLFGRADLSQWLEERRLHRDAADGAAVAAIAALNVRDFAGFEAALAPVEIDDLSGAVLDDYFRGPDLRDALLGVDADINAAAPSVRWAPMSEAGLRMLQARAGAVVIPSHWRLSASEIAGALASGALPESDIRPIDRRRLSATWSRAEQAQLLRAGVHGLIGDRANGWRDIPLAQVIALARQRSRFREILVDRLDAGAPALEILEAEVAHRDIQLIRLLHEVCNEETTGSRFIGDVVEFVGTPEWRAAGGWPVHGSAVFDGICRFASSRRKPRDIDAFLQEMTAFLGPRLAQTWKPAKATSARTPGQGETNTPFSAAAALVARYPKLLTALAANAPAADIAPLIPYIRSRRNLESFQKRGPPELAGAVLQVRADRAESPGALIALLIEGARAGWPIPWNPAWLEFARPAGWKDGASARLDEDAIQNLTALVLALRRQIKKLRAVSVKVHEDDLRKALARAASALGPVRRNEAALLELAARLPRSEMSYLAAAVAQRDMNAPRGCRLGGQYFDWQLPKRSGGTRTISAPSATLKRTQRAILSALLDPLGAHPAAYGFVRGRSIAHNAAAHVGRKVVVNGDVANCFPSVRWPLVDAALRRDFAGELSATAIGLIVDLCTARGGLPIGAPTSPALLNRVLLLSDGILTREAARRDCVYTRYADDLTFSGDGRAVEMLGVAKGVLGRIGLSLDPRKTNIFRRGRRQMVTGLVVNEQVSVPRRLRRRLRAATHRASQGQKTEWHGAEQTMQALRGRIAFLAMVHPAEARRLRAMLADGPDIGTSTRGVGRDGASSADMRGAEDPS